MIDKLVIIRREANFAHCKLERLRLKFQLLHLLLDKPGRIT